MARVTEAGPYAAPLICGRRGCSGTPARMRAPCQERAPCMHDARAWEREQPARPPGRDLGTPASSRALRIYCRSRSCHSRNSAQCGRQARRFPPGHARLSTAGRAGPAAHMSHLTVT